MQQASIIEQGMITGAHDICKLQIIDWNRLNGYWNNDPSQAITIATQWLTHDAAYTIAHIPLHRVPDRPDWPGWTHTGSHEELGKLFWNNFHATCRGTLTFADEPDFTGTFIHPALASPAQFYGDIGKVSASTFLFTLTRMHAGDRWISVLNEETQVIIEALSDFQAEFARLLEDEFGI